MNIPSLLTLYPSGSPPRSALIVTNGPSYTTAQSGNPNYNIQVTVTWDGMVSAPYLVFNNVPYSNTVVNAGQFCNANGCDCNANNPGAGLQGFNTLNQVYVRDLFGNALTPIVLHEIALQRIFKGAASPGTIHVSHSWSRGGMVDIGIQAGTRTLSATVQGLWCLQPGATSDWDVAPINGPDGVFMNLPWPASQTVPAAYQITDAALPDTLLFELAAGVESDGVNPEIAIGAAPGAQSSSLQLVANRFMNSSIPEFQIAGLSGLLPLQPSLIGSVSGLWPSVSSNPRRFTLVYAIRDTFRDPSPNSVQQLIQLASLAPDLREAAIHALSSIHTQQALPFLAGLLTSSDPNEQARGVFGLSSFANGCPPQTPANVVSMAYLQCSNQGPYASAGTVANSATPGAPSAQTVAFWANWWNQYQAALGGN